MKKISHLFKSVTQRIRLFFSNHRDKLEYIDGLLFSNPVLIEGLAIAPAVAATQNLKSAVILSIGFVWVVALDVLLVRLLFSKAGEVLRTVMCAVIGAALFIPLAFGLRLLFPYVSSTVGLYLPIMIVDSVILSKSELYIELQQGHLRMALELIFHSLGFALVVCLMGYLREMMAYGTVWGLSIGAPVVSTAVALPFFGFFMLAMLSAFTKFLTNRFYYWINKKPAQKEADET